MQPRRKRRMRCTYCGSLATKRNGKRKLTPVSFDRRSKRCECTALREVRRPAADEDGLLNHQKDNLIPKTNNLAENKNRLIKRRFTPLDDLNK